MSKTKGHHNRAGRFARWALPGLVFTVGYTFAACYQPSGAPPQWDCPQTPGDPGSGGAAAEGGGYSDGSGSPPTVGETPGSTFDHDNQNPFDVLAQLEAEGPLEVRARLHSCGKITYGSLGAVLASRGAQGFAPSNENNPFATNDPFACERAPSNALPTACELYWEGATAMGGAQFDSHQPEASFASAGAMTKIFDVIVQAAPEIIANLSAQPACQRDGAGVALFNQEGSCVSDGFACLVGRSITAEELAVCDDLASSEAPNAQALAVAVFLSAALTCS